MTHPLPFSQTKCAKLTKLLIVVSQHVGKPSSTHADGHTGNQADAHLYTVTKTDPEWPAQATPLARAATCKGYAGNRKVNLSKGPGLLQTRRARRGAVCWPPSLCRGAGRPLHQRHRADLQAPIRL